MKVLDMLTNSYFDKILTKVHEAKEKRHPTTIKTCLY